MSNLLKNGQDIDGLFAPRVTSSISNTGLLSAGVDIATLYERVANGSNSGVNTGLLANGNDVRNLFAATGTVTGALYDYSGGTYVKILYYGYTDSKTGFHWQWTNFYVYWGGVQKYSSTIYSSLSGSTLYFNGNDGYTYTLANIYATPSNTVTNGTTTEERYWPVSRAVVNPTITSFTRMYAATTTGLVNYVYPVFAGGTGVIGTSGTGSSQISSGATSGGIVAVYPTSTTTYTLTVGGTVTASVTLTVYAAPSITSFTTSATSVAHGTAVTLTPTFSAPGGQATISGIGTVTSGTGYSVTPPDGITGYALDVYNGASVPAYVSSSLQVTSSATPVITSFTVSPDVIYYGDGSTLYPVFTGGTGVITGTGAPGAVTSGSSYAINPPVGVRTYTLTVTPPAGSAITSTCVLTTYATCSTDGCPHDLYCPGPDVAILMADGSEKRAQYILAGDMVMAYNERTGAMEPEEVLAVYARHDSHRYRIILDNGREGMFAHNHRFLTAEGTWKALDTLVPGEALHGGVVVCGIQAEEGLGTVIPITVSNLHTYVTLGVVSHNIKQLY